ncbi:hypothetical protein MSG28_008311, partial [Choristoneura fumiferana]
MSTFEEAYDTTALLTCGFILLYVTTECLGVGYVLNRAECDLDITVTERGLIAASTLIGVVTPAIFWGYMGDEYGRRKVMLPTILATVVVSICSSMAVNFWNIISASCATVYVYLGFGWAILPHKWSLPITGDLNLVPWRVFMWAWCLWGVLAAIGLYILPESPRYLLATRGPEAVVPVLAKMYAWNHNLHVDDYPTTLTSMCSLMNSKYSGGEHAHHQHETAECRTVAINNLMYPISMVTGVLTAIIALALCTLFMIGRLGAAMGAHLVGMGLQANCTMFNNLALLTCGFILLYVTTECLGAGYMLNGAECDLNISVTERGFVAAATFIASIATVYAFLGELHTASHRASALAYGSAFIACSLFIMPGMAWLILPGTWSLHVSGRLSIVPWRVFMWSWCFWGALGALGLSILPESPRYLLATKGPNAVLPVLAKITNAFYVWMPHIVNELLSSNVTTSMCNIMDMKYANKPEKPETHKCEDPVIDSRMYPISMFMGILTAIIYRRRHELTLYCVLFLFGEMPKHSRSNRCHSVEDDVDCVFMTASFGDRLRDVVRYVRAAPAAQNHSIRQDCTMTEDRKTEATPFEDALDKT